MAPSQEQRRGTKSVPVSGAFDAVWTTLVHVLGAPTATTVVRRSARRASGRRPALAELTIHRAALDYEVELPASWRASEAESLHDVQALAGELRVVLHELTGVLVVRALNEHPTLKTLGWFVPEDR